MDKIIEGSKEIFDKAVSDFKPKAVVLMFSGGDDSLTTYHVAKELGIGFDYVIHGNTGTGIKETTDFVRNEVVAMGDKYLEADAGTSYIDYVLRKGFFGVGEMAHNYSYHVLKITHFRTIVSHNLRKRKRDFPILFVNGARRKESENRKKTMISPYHRDPAQKNNIWVNLINEWDKPECKDYLEGNGVKRNPVAEKLCRSGECLCGTMQDEGDRTEASFFYPDWGKWIDELEKAVLEKGFMWGWGESLPKGLAMEKKGQLNMFQPMCVGCTIKNQ